MLVAVLVAFVVVIGTAIARNISRRKRDKEQVDEPIAKGPEAPLPVERGPIETDVERLLARARAAAMRGDYRGALDDTYASAPPAPRRRRPHRDSPLAHQRRLHPNAPRKARRDGPCAGRLPGRRARSLWCGTALRGGLPIGARPRRSPGESGPRCPVSVSRRLHGPLCIPHHGTASGSGTRADTSPSGTAALVEVLEKHEFKVRYRLEGLDKLEKPLTLVILPGAEIDAGGWKHLLTWVREQGGRLVLAGISNLPEELNLRTTPDSRVIAHPQARLRVGLRHCPRPHHGISFEEASSEPGRCHRLRRRIASEERLRGRHRQAPWQRQSPGLRRFQPVYQHRPPGCRQRPLHGRAHERLASAARNRVLRRVDRQRRLDTVRVRAPRGAHPRAPPASRRARVALRLEGHGLRPTFAIPRKARGAPSATT